MSSKTILIADDDIELVKSLEIRCKAIGLNTVTAYDAMNALSLARKIQPDVFLVDVDMPTGNGLAVCEMLCDGVNPPKMPVIILTGRTDEDVVRRCFEMGVFYVLKSTDTWERLLPLLEEFLEPAASAPNASEQRLCNDTASQHESCSTTFHRSH